MLVRVQFGEQANPGDAFSAAAASLAGRRVGAAHKGRGGLPFGAFEDWYEEHLRHLPEEPTAREVSAWRRAFMDGVRQRNPKAGEVTDRAKRYRAQKNVKGPKQCVLCGSRSDLGVMHLDGFEDHGEAKNLAWGCRSCNQILSHGFKRAGAGKRTRQYNPSQGVPTFEQYAWAVSQGAGGSHHGPYIGGGKFAPGPHDAAGAVIHATPKAKRVEYARRIAGLKGEHGTAGRGGYDDSVPF